MHRRSWCKSTWALAPKKPMKEQKSNGKRYLPLPDIYTPIDKTSALAEAMLC